MNRHAEWLEADGLGGFASGRADGIRTRRYHGLLTIATTPPTGRIVLVNGLDAWVETPDGAWAISSQRYTPDVTHPDGAARIAAFSGDPWPTWTYRLPNGLEIVQELVVLHGTPLVALSWQLLQPAEVTLVLRPLLSGRDAHGEHHENADFSFTSLTDDERICWRPYAHAPEIVAVTNGLFEPDPTWYRNFQYDEERARGLGFVEDLASPGTLTYSLADQRAVLVLGTTSNDASSVLDQGAARAWEIVSTSERARRAAFPSSLHRAADSYIVRRGAGKTIVAGYPWFSDWGRDTFIALRGLCIAGDRLSDACDILLEWSHHVSEGMLPNFFPDSGTPAEYNSVDASLWYVIAVHDLLRATEGMTLVSAEQRDSLLDAVEAIVWGYARGTRFGIRADGTGLLAAGEPGVQLTWMDAKLGDWVVTPRIGKPVEIQALWINALRIAGQRSPRWASLAEVAQASFTELFWNAARGSLYDVVDVDHQRGALDASVRPNQIFAVGGLPWPVLQGERARSVVDVVESKLWTVAGLRSLAPDEPGYAPHYGGDMRARDAAYHQGTVWPWLAGAFVDAWVQVHGGTIEARAEVRERFVLPLLDHFRKSAPGHVGEVADGEPPHAPGGCPFQAWSVGEVLRALHETLGPARATGASMAVRAAARSMA
jgi:predicted glycogen debranching enzyme